MWLLGSAHHNVDAVRYDAIRCDAMGGEVDAAMGRVVWRIGR